MYSFVFFTELRVFRSETVDQVPRQPYQRQRGATEKWHAAATGADQQQKVREYDMKMCITTSRSHLISHTRCLIEEIKSHWPLYVPGMYMVLATPPLSLFSPLCYSLFL